MFLVLDINYSTMNISACDFYLKFDIKFKTDSHAKEFAVEYFYTYEMIITTGLYLDYCRFISRYL